MYTLTTVEDKIKLNLFTLSCHVLLSRLAHLRETTQQVPSTYRDCLDKFNHELQDMLVRSFGDPQAALDYLLTGLESARSKIARIDAHAARIIEDATSEFRSLAPSWSYDQQFETLHDQARQLAREFYLRYPDDDQAIDFSSRYVLNYERDREKTANPMRCDTSTLAIFVFFSLRHRFEDYVACLFLFLHEYTAHIYAENRTKNVLFQDGWMMYAAADFLYRKWLASDQLPSYAYECHFTGCRKPVTQPPVSSLDQAEVDDYVRACCTDRHSGERHEWRVFKAIHNFNDYLEDSAYFAQLTRQLAWFRPGAGESPKFQTRFVNRLQNEFESGARSDLRAFARQHPDVRTLMNYLEQTETNRSPARK